MTIGSYASDYNQGQILRQVVEDVLPAKQDSTLSAGQLGAGSVARGVVDELRDLGAPANQEYVKTSSYTLVAADRRRRIVAGTGCSLITVPLIGTLGNSWEVTIVNDSGGQLTIDGLSGSTNVVIEDGDIAVIMETNSKQRVTYGFSTVIS